MSQILVNEAKAPRIVDRAEYHAEIDTLRLREKAHTKEGDAIAATRRRLPMVKVDGATFANYPTSTIGMSPTQRFARAIRRERPVSRLHGLEATLVLPRRGIP